MMPRGVCIGGPAHGVVHETKERTSLVFPVAWQAFPGATSRDAEARYEWCAGFWRFDALLDVEFARLKAEVAAGQFTYEWKPEPPPH